MLRWWTFSKECVLILQDFRVLVQGGIYGFILLYLRVGLH